MICKVCGRETANENANFCDYCGSSFREHGSMVQNELVNGLNEQSNMVNYDNKENEKSISFGNWIGSMLLPFIPIIGPFIYLVMLFVWAFGSDTPKSKKNWARASLIMIIVAIVMLISLVSSAVMDFANSGLTMDEFMKQYIQPYN